MTTLAVKKSTEPGTLYDRDYYAWTQQQAGLLKAGRLADVDLQHLIEEVEDMGGEQKRAVRSHLRHLLTHLVKLHCSPADDPRRGWRDEVRNARDEIEDRLAGSPSLKSHVEELLTDVWPGARRRAAGQMADFGEHPDVPTDCPFTPAQVLDNDYWPDRMSEAASSGSTSARRADGT